MNECDTCVHNRGSHCDAEACSEGDAYEGRIYSCPFCGGRLSTLREQGGSRLRHCYACHFEWEVEEEEDVYEKL